MTMIDFSLLPMTTIDLDRLTLLTHGYSFLTGGRPPLEGHEEVSAAMRRLNRLDCVEGTEKQDPRRTFFWKHISSSEDHQGTYFGQN